MKLTESVALLGLSLGNSQGSMSIKVGRTTTDRYGGKLAPGINKGKTRCLFVVVLGRCLVPLSLCRCLVSFTAVHCKSRPDDERSETNMTR
jgi:hypothetical protein